MECGFCKTRSAIGYCVECRNLVCEGCAVVCQACGKLVCREHVHETPHRRRLCIKCYSKRNTQFELVIAEMQDYCRQAVEAGDDQLVFVYSVSVR